MERRPSEPTGTRTLHVCLGPSVTVAPPQPRRRRAPSWATVVVAWLVSFGLVAAMVVAATGADTPVYPSVPLTLEQRPDTLHGVPVDELAAQAVVRVAADAGDLDDAAAALADAHDDVTAAQPLFDRFVRLTGVDAATAGDLPSVAHAEDDRPMRLAGGAVTRAQPVPLDDELDDGAFGQQWALRNLGQAIPDLGAGRRMADIGWAVADRVGGQHGDGARVAVIDTGLDVDHPAFGGRLDLDDARDLVAVRDDADTDGACRDEGIIDDDGVGDVEQRWRCLAEQDARQLLHGTHVAGAIAAAGDDDAPTGVAPGATIVPYRVSSGDLFWMSDAAYAISLAAEADVDVINASFVSADADEHGSRYDGEGEDEPVGADGDDEPVTERPGSLTAAVEHARDQGVLIVAAAGNGPRSLDTGSQARVWPASYAADDHFTNVLAVTATDNRDRVAWYANHGPDTVALAAPGSSILASIPAGSLADDDLADGGPHADATYAYVSGTSMAAAVTAGAAAVVATSGLLPEDGSLGTHGAGGAEGPHPLRQRLLDGAETVEALDRYVAQRRRLSLAGALDLALRVEGYHLHDLAPGRITDPAHVNLRGPDDLAPRFTLGYLHEGEMHAVVDHPVVLKEDLRRLDARTDGQGRIGTYHLDGDQQAAALGDGVGIHLRTTLPEGRFALLVEDANEPDIDPVVLLFEIAEPQGPDGSDGCEPDDEDCGSPELGCDAGDEDCDDPTGPEDCPDGTDDPDCVSDEVDCAEVPDHADCDLPCVEGSQAAGCPDDDTPGGGGDDGTDGTDDTEPDDGSTTPPDGCEPDQDEGCQPAESCVPGEDDGCPTQTGPDPSDPVEPDDPVTPDPEPSGRVEPPTGPAGQGTDVVVHVEGLELEEWMFFRFGTDEATDVVIRPDGAAAEMTTPALPAGTVDVTIGTVDEHERVLLRGAFTYQAQDDVDDPDGGDQPGPPDLGPAPEPGEPDGPTWGAPTLLDNGLLVDRYTSHHPLSRVTDRMWDDHLCQGSPCAAVRL